MVVITGVNKGQKGRVLEVVRKTNRAIVEGVNLIKKHTKPNTENPQGGILEQEAPVHISNLMLVDPKSGEATRIGRKVNDQGELVRFSKKTGEEIK